MSVNWLLDEGWRTAIDAEIDMEDTIEALFAPLVVDDSQLSLFDYDAEVEELIDARMDEDWIRGGC
jgi:hypothetical protein